MKGKIALLGMVVWDASAVSSTLWLPESLKSRARHGMDGEFHWY